MKKLLLAVLLLTLGTLSHAGGPNKYRIGLNVGWQTEISPRLYDVIQECQTIGVDHVRMDIRDDFDPWHYSQVMDLFAGANIRVLVVFTSDSWNGSRSDWQHYNAHGWSVCNHYFPGDNPSNWGNNNVINYLQAIAPYVDALKGRWNLLGMELWNEVTNAANHLCAADYAWMITEAKVWWPYENWGVSTESHNYSAYSWQFVQKLATNTDKVNWYKATHGQALPWGTIMHHPYGTGQNNATDVKNYLAYQSAQFKAVQNRPLWFTEIGWVAGSESYQNDRLKNAVDAVIDYNLADRVFWYALYDCTPGYGLIRNQCHYAKGNGYRRPAWYTFQNLLTYK